MLYCTMQSCTVLNYITPYDARLLENPQYAKIVAVGVAMPLAAGLWLRLIPHVAVLWLLRLWL